MKTFIVTFALVVVNFIAHAQPWEFRKALRATKQDYNDKLGWSVDIANDFALMGAYEDRDDANESPSTNSGAAYFAWRYPDNSWKIIQKVVPSDLTALNFGYSVALNEHYAVVGAPRGSGSYMLAGSAFIYEKNTNGTWVEVTKIEPSDQVDFHEFGYAVAIHNKTIVVSAPKRNVGSTVGAGAIYVFERNEQGVWNETQKLVASDPQTAWMGRDIAIENDIIVAGAPYERDETTSDNNHGAVYVFKKNATTGLWEESIKLVTPDRKHSATFGWAVDLNQGQLIASAESEDHYGAVYFFNLENDDWTFKQRIASPMENAFGHAVAISGNRAVIGYGDHPSVNTARIYERDPQGQWNLSTKIFSPDYDFNISRGDKFGNEVAIDEQYAIIGGPGADQEGNPNYNPTSAGAAYIFEATGKPAQFSEVKLADANKDIYFPTLIDYDNDGDLDSFVGYHDHDNQVNEGRIYKLENGTYTPIAQRFPSLEYYTATAWLDVNGDGWLDLIVNYQVNYEPRTELYLNNHDDTFTVKDITTGVFSNEWEGAMNFADYDNDLDQDLLVRLKVEPGAPPKMKLFRNKGAFTFEDGLVFDGVAVKSSSPWFDYNNDGFIDFMAVQSISCEVNRLVLFQNSGGQQFQKISTSLPSLNAWDFYNQSGDMQWMDYDADGDADIVWSGTHACSTGDASSDVYVNNNGFFSSALYNFRSLYWHVDLDVVDYDNDGRQDILAYGEPMSGLPDMQFLMWPLYQRLKLYEMPRPSQYGGTDFGDVEGDGDVDVLISHNNGLSLLKNNAAQGWTVKNLPPGVPQPHIDFNDNNVSISWPACFDASHSFESH
jgi:hypothetical protein